MGGDKGGGGERLSRNMYKGPMGKAKVGYDWGWEVGVGKAGESGYGKMETTVFKKQLKNLKHKET